MIKAEDAVNRIQQHPRHEVPEQRPLVCDTHQHKAPKANVMQGFVDVVEPASNWLLGGDPQKEAANEGEAAKQVAEFGSVASYCLNPGAH